MQHLRSGARQKLQLRVAERGNWRWIFDDARIGGQNARHIRPVFIHVRVQRRGGKTARNIGAAAREGMDAPVGQRAVKPRRDDLPPSARDESARIGAVGQHVSGVVKLQPACRIDERKAEICCHQLCRKILSARGEKICARLRREVFIDGVQLVFNGEIDRAIRREWRGSARQFFAKAPSTARRSAGARGKDRVNR